MFFECVDRKEIVTMIKKIGKFGCVDKGWVSQA